MVFKDMFNRVSSVINASPCVNGKIHRATHVQFSKHLWYHSMTPKQTEPGKEIWKKDIVGTSRHADSSALEGFVCHNVQICWKTFRKVLFLFF